MIVSFLTRRPFSARMDHSRQSRTKRPFQPVFRGGKQRFSVLPTAGFRKGRGFVIGERKRMVQNPPACPTIAFPIARQCLTHWRAVSFLLSYSNYGTCADSPFPDIPLRRREKRPFRTLLRPLSRRFSPFEKTADFSPNSPFSTSNPAILHFFLNSVAWISRENTPKSSPQKNSR